MRLTCFSIVLALAAGFLADRTLAQIPERVTFQPGSFAHGYRPGVAVPGVAMAVAQPVAVIETEAVEAADDDEATPKTEWEEKFGEKGKPAQPAQTEVVYIMPAGEATTASACKKDPYLAWHRCPWTGRIHLIPYQPGYAEAPEQFPTHQSKLNLWLSSLPCREQSRPQQKYLSYYDETPEILTDKPSRCQLILGYDDPNWTASCCNSSLARRKAHCPGVDPLCFGPSAEARIVDQVCNSGPINGRGMFAGPAPYAGYGYANPRGVFGYRQGYMQQQPCPPQPWPCPEQCMQCPQPLKPAPLPVPACSKEPSCSDANPCNDCVNKRPCTPRKASRTLEKNAPKMKNCVGDSNNAAENTELVAMFEELSR